MYCPKANSEDFIFDGIALAFLHSHAWNFHILNALNSMVNDKLSSHVGFLSHILTILGASGIRGIQTFNYNIPFINHANQLSSE